MTIVHEVGTASVADRLAAITPIVDELRAGDAAAERDRVLQYDAVRALRATGVLSLRVPVDYGGPGGNVRDVLTAVIHIASASSNVAQALRPHFGFVERLLSNRATERERLLWYPRINAGLVVGNAVTDARGRVPGSGETTVLPDADGVLRLNGQKFYSTGTLFADAVAVSAVDAVGNDLQAVVPTDRPGVELLDDWDGFGQRTTATGTSRFTDVLVEPEEVTTVSSGKFLGHGTAFLQLYLAAVTAGIAAAVRTDAVDFVRHRARPAAHSAAPGCGRGFRISAFRASNSASVTPPRPSDRPSTGACRTCSAREPGLCPGHANVAHLLHSTQRNGTDLHGTGWTAHHLEPLL